MSLIKKCSICYNKGLTLKLTDGLCPICLSELKSIEASYIDNLKKISNQSYDKSEIINSIKEILISLPKFKSINTTVTLDDCLTLLSTLDNKIPNFSTLENFSPNPIKENSHTTIDFLISDLPNTSIESTSNKFMSNEAINNYPSKDEIRTKLYKEIQPILNTLNNASTSLNLLAENLFTLKTTYSPLLKQADIEEVDGINISKVISDTTRILMVRTNQKENNLYGFFNYIAYSIQTNGIRAYANDIIEICAYKIQYGKIIDTFYTLINPMKSIDKTIETSTGISTKDVESAPTIDIVLPNFIKFIEDFKLLSHNSRFTSAFIKDKYKLLYDSPIPNKFECTMDLYKVQYKNYHGEATEQADIHSCVIDLLPQNDIAEIESHDSISVSTTIATYLLYEILKYKYK